MKKWTRRILFWCAVVIFAIASWAAIRYAQGYAYDFEAGAFVRTGAVAMTVSTSASFSLDDVVSGDTSFLGNRAGKDGLLPGTYALRVFREGYTSWHKNISIQEGRLTDFPNVLILPTDDASLLALKQEASESMSVTSTLSPARDGDFLLERGTLLDVRTASPSIVAEHVIGFTLSDDENRVLWWTRNEVWVMWLQNTDQQPYRTEGERQAITRFAVPIQRGGWFRGNDHVVIDLGNQSYRIIETDARGGANIIKL